MDQGPRTLALRVRQGCAYRKSEPAERVITVIVIGKRIRELTREGEKKERERELRRETEL